MSRHTPLWNAPLDRRAFFGLAGAGAGAGALALTSCGMQTGNGSEGDGGEGSSVIRAAYGRPIVDLDPFGPSNVATATLIANAMIFDTLVVRGDGGIEPGLATEWTQPDDRTWVFSLRDAMLHDGTPITAEDVKACIENIVQGETPQSALWPALDVVEASDQRTVTIRTSTPLGTMLSNLSLLSIVPADKLGDSSYFANPVGSGPFSVDSFTPSDHLNLVAEPEYWGSSPRAARVDLPYIPEPSSRRTALQTGEIDIMWPVPPDQRQELEQAGVELLDGPSFVNYFNWFNSSREPFTDVRVRRAMWMAIDVAQVVTDLFGDSAELATAPIPSPVFGYSAQEPYPYDPEQARSLLAEAGLADGFSTHLMWAGGQSPQIRQLGESFASYWNEIGVTVELQELEQSEWLDRLLALDWDMELQGAGNVTGDADYTLGRLYSTEANRMGYSNHELDEVLSGARSTTDQDERAELYAQACKIIWDDAVGIFPLDPLATYGVQEDIEGLVPSPNDQPDFVPVHRSA